MQAWVGAALIAIGTAAALGAATPARADWRGGEGAYSQGYADGYYAHRYYRPPPPYRPEPFPYYVPRGYYPPPQAYAPPVPYAVPVRPRAFAPQCTLKPGGWFCY